MTSIAVMNAKGGVGKSTLTMALAETLALDHGKHVLLIDSDGQMSLSLMQMPVERLNDLAARHATLAALLAHLVAPDSHPDWRSYVVSGIGDVEDVETLHIIPGDMDLTLIERDIVAGQATGRVREACRRMLLEAAEHVDVVLVDCAPGISVMTEIWLRECDWHLIPVKPDVLAVSGLQYLQAFQNRNREAGFAKRIGAIINMAEPHLDTDLTIEEYLRSNGDLHCFSASVPLTPHIKKANLFQREKRSFLNKYPGEAGRAIRLIGEEMLARLASAADATAISAQHSVATAR